MKKLIKVVLIGVFALGFSSQAATTKKHLETKITNITQTLLQIRLAEGISLEDAGEAMVSKASDINMKLVGRQRVHVELRNRGIETPHLEIFQFCDPESARKAVVGNYLYAAYMPCSVALVEDNDGVPWLLMLNLDMLINNNVLSPELTEVAIDVNKALLDIITAGATGEF
jgi:uncharacterized protein (DUF302 family)